MDLFQFKYPENLWLLFLIPILILLLIFSRYTRIKRISKLGDTKLIEQLIPDYSKYRIVFKYSLLILSLSFLIIALARPQTGSKVKVDTVKNREIIIAMDVSNSMSAEDIKPSRLFRAKQLVSKLYTNNPADRIGLIVFAGDAYVQVPVTSGFSGIDVIMESVSPESVPIQGTNIAKAIEMGISMFDKSEENEKLILILTDGENHEPKAIEAAKQAHSQDIIVSTVGIGKKGATPIPDTKTGEYKKKNGKVVITKLNDILLTQIANAGGGNYYETGNFFRDLSKIQSQIDNLGSVDGKTEIEAYADLFPYFVVLALLLLIFEFVLLEKRNHKLTNLSIFK